MEERSKVQNIWLLVLAAMAVLFLMLTMTVRSRTGVLFHDALLKVQGTVENGAYSGKAHGEDVSIVVIRHGETEVGLELFISNVAHENWLVEYPLAPVQTEHGQRAGLRISRSGEIVFEGAYDPELKADWGYMLYDADGKLWLKDLFSVSVGTDAGSYWDDYETGVQTVLRFVNGPEITARGSLQLWFYGLLLSAMAAVLVAFPNTLFRLNHRWYVKNPEPTEFYFLSTRIGSGFVTIVALVSYIAGVCTIP